MSVPNRAPVTRGARAGLRFREMGSRSGWAALLVFFGACGGTEPSVPTAVVLSPTSLSFTAIGEEQQLSPSTTDQDGNPIDVALSWSTSNAGVATVTESGLVTARATGSAEITATVGSASATAPVSVVQAPAQLQKISGDGQVGPAGQPLAAPVVVQANDARGNPIAGASVNFAVSSGGGQVSSSVGITAANGRAATTVTVGNAAGLPQEISATLPNTTISTTFTATAQALPSSFDIEIQYLTAATASQQQAFTEARLRWEGVIFGDLEETLLQANAGDCGDSPAFDRTVDDVLILVVLESIDGPGGTLGQARPCYIRDPGDLTVLGFMQFDTDDLEAVEASGLLSEVIVHEMGHVLGFGSLWDLQSLLAGASLPPTNGTDPHFTGIEARNAFDLIGGTTYAAGLKVPVENMGGPGRADGHWRESVFDNELMTGLIAGGQNPLSIVTLASLADQGYLVNLAGADAYSLTLSLRAFGGSSPMFQLTNDVMSGPIKKVDRRGRVTSEFRR
jgi:hypothetical protein